ncbi:unnamed protein product [Didymodactylos carnosus]|uniref:Uncharacterized protein n=1 Tax=Didymodactylos carnosus TaxID=1234261 RepID=A0A8S2LPN8_9BILA|nr:unnamed protein product [Didymodactylos carnosus]CAF3912275.1 unnamed protein product [Didymodactylos carnosus]
MTILSQFKTASEQLSADHEPTPHLVVPWFCKLKSFCADKNSDTLTIHGFKKALRQKLDGKIWLTSLHYSATFLHPTTKALSALTKREREEILADTRKLIVTLQIPKSDHENIKQAPKSKRFKKDLITVNAVLKEFACQDDQEIDEEEQDEVAEYSRATLRFSSEEAVKSRFANRHSPYWRLANVS